MGPPAVPLPRGLLARVLTAAALLGAFLGALLLLERAFFAGLLAVVLGLASFEWARLCGLSGRAGTYYAAGVATLFAILAWFPGTLGEARELLIGAGALFWLLLAPLWLRVGLGGRERVPLAVAGALVLVIAGVAAVSLPPLLLLMVLGLVWIADTAAYFAGNAFGKHKLAPSISPGKTWEGVAGAAFATIVYAIACAWPGAPLGTYVHGAGWAPYVAAAALLCAVSIVGDLFESALKRRAGAKDSGGLLPGHGGVLDRVDSILPTLPIAALLINAMMKT